ncbi:MAG TPA: hypothetical protein VK031_06590 [Tissierellaceae bacterium]|nr:hypothetical protein [Tissierellaceae bacterium]
MKFKKDFLATCSHPELFNNLLNSGGVPWADLRRWPDDYISAESGIPGLTYYNETEKIYNQNSGRIHRYFDYLNNEGLEIVNPYCPINEEVSYKNWAVWVAWESMMSDIIHFLES